MRHAFIAGGAVLVGLLSGCQTTPELSLPTPPGPILLSSDPLLLPDDCLANVSLIVEFDVESTGRTSNIYVPPSDSCLRMALTAWVASFRYAPQSGTTPMSLEWFMVAAEKGS